MKYRSLGNTGIKVSEIGFGAWGIGGDSYGSTDDVESKRALRFAFDKGISFYDTADVYGAGRSESLIGVTLKDVRKEIIIATKVGSLSYSGRNMLQDFSVDRIREGLNASLRRLQTDYIDVYQLHSPPIEVLDNDKLDKLIDVLESLKKEGKFRVLGISVRSPRDGMVAIKKKCFGSIQVNFSMIDHRFIDDGLNEAAIQGNVGIITRTPLCFGFLTGTLSGNTVFEQNDHRSGWSKKQRSLWSESVHLFETIYKKKGWTPTQLALKFSLSYKGVSTVIPGMISSRQVEENISSSEIDDLMESDLTVVRKIYDTHIFFDSAQKK